MAAPRDLLSPAVSAAIARALGPEFEGTDPVLRPSQYADVQANAALALAKRVGRRRRATWPPASSPSSATCPPRVEISGPGFLNVTFDDAWIASLLADARRRPAARACRPSSAQVVPIDYSAPNVAKEMHVGHLRTTVVGDALARTLEHLGHRVVRQNHIGDWGTPFGMLIEHLLAVGEDSDEARLLESDPNAFYQAARAEFDGDDGVRDAGPGPGGRAAGRRRGDAAAVGRAGRAVAPLLQPDLLHARRDARPTTTWPASRRTTPTWPGSATSSRRPGWRR